MNFQGGLVQPSTSGSSFCVQKFTRMIENAWLQAENVWSTWKIQENQGLPTSLSRFFVLDHVPACVMKVCHTYRSECIIEIFLMIDPIILPSLKLTVRTWKWAKSQKETIVFQPSIFRCKNVSFRGCTLLITHKNWCPLPGIAPFHPRIYIGIGKIGAFWWLTVFP